MATPTVRLAQLSRIAGDGTLAVDPQSGRPAKTPVIKCCQCESVASSQSQLPIKAMGKLATGNWYWQHSHIGNIQQGNIR